MEIAFWVVAIVLIILCIKFCINDISTFPIFLMFIVLWFTLAGLLIPWKYEYKQTAIPVTKTEFGYVADTPLGLIKETEFQMVSTTVSTDMVVIEKVSINLVKDSTYTIQKKGK